MKNHVRNQFPFKRPLSANSLVQNLRNETMFGYVQCDLSIPDVTRNDIVEYIKTYAEENDLLNNRNEC